MVPHLVDGQNATADHLCLGGDKGGHHQSGAITEAQARLNIESLQKRTSQGHTHVHAHTRITAQQPLCTLQQTSLRPSFGEAAGAEAHGSSKPKAAPTGPSGNTPTPVSGQPDQYAPPASTWKCLVWPGVADTETFFLPRMVLIVELFPTLG